MTAPSSDSNAARQVVARCRGISKAYGAGDATVLALQGVDLDVHLQELLMIVGPSGSGKTTLLSIVAGILDQDAGECVVNGQEPRRMDAGERARFRARTIGFVFQAFNLLPSLTSAENVAVPLLINRLSRAEALRRAQAALESIELGGRTHALPGELSGGQQQRVAIARAFVHEPKLIICDEPTSNLDHATGHRVMEILRAMAKTRDRALIVVTHDQRILEFADRIAHMDDGRIVDVTQSARAERPT